jgi:hypothetical protein
MRESKAQFSDGSDRARAEPAPTPAGRIGSGLLPAIARLSESLRRFQHAMEATTVPMPDGSRRVIGISGGPLTLSDAHCDLCGAFFQLACQVFLTWGERLPVPGGKGWSGLGQMRVGPGGCPPAVAAVLEPLLHEVLPSPAGRHQPPGVQRFQFADELGKRMLDALECARKAVSFLLSNDFARPPAPRIDERPHAPRPCVAEAGHAFEAACNARPDLPTGIATREHWQFLRDHAQELLLGATRTSYETWARYVRDYLRRAAA